jgi:uncharacterized repeat protein (TIGR01451 family)
MNARRAGLLLGLTLLAAGGSAAVPPPPEVHNPLLYVRIQGPEGMVAAFVGGAGSQRLFDTPLTVGLRPGRVYRLRLDGLPDHPGEVLYPSLEVWGTLRLPPNARGADHPAPVVIRPADIRRALAGTLVTKVIALEDPEKASPISPPEGEPAAELTVAPAEDPVEYAQALGRPVLIVRIGQREPDPQELARQAGHHALLPGDHCLPPQGPFGPRLPRTPHFTLEECLRDGGDRGQPAYFDANGQLRGVDPSDSVAEYTDSLGRRRLGVTNTVCLCVPRFLSVTHLLPAVELEGVRQPGNLGGLQERVLLTARQDSRRVRLLEEPETLHAGQKLQANVVVTPPLRLTHLQVLRAVEMLLGPAEFIGTEKVLTLTEVEKVRLIRQVELALALSQPIGTKRVVDSQTTQVVGVATGIGQVIGRLETREASCICVPEPPKIPEQPLHLCKWVSTHSAQIGDVVTFYIRYSNLGGRPIRDIAVSDSLTARLEYLPGTAKSDREAVFVTQENEAGSLILRWEIRDPLPPNQRGVVSFQARIK